MRRLSVEEIELQATRVVNETKSLLPGFFESSARALNVLIDLLYAAPRHRRVSPARDEFVSQAINWLYSAIYTFDGAIRLMSSGHYFEAQVLLRTLVEVLIKLRYFDMHPEDMQRLPSLATGRKGSITWRAMFDAVWPGYYDEYSRLAYEAHGGIGANTYKLSRDSGKRALVMGLQYSEFWATAFINELTPVLLGYLRALLSIFGNDWIPEDLKRDYDCATQTLESAIKEHIARYGRNDWHDRIEPMWNC